MWKQCAARELAVTLDDWQQLGGGDFAQSWRARVVGGSSTVLAVGDSVFVKSHAAPPPKHFSTEARGLAWLRETGAVAVPEVLGVSDDPPYLALQWIEEGARTGIGEADFGRSLAALHRSPCTHYGRLDQRTTGSLGLPNEPGHSWAGFYATQRLLPLVRIARDRQSLGKGTLQDIERLAGRLDDLVDSEVMPSRLHGDLWAGNRLVDRHGQSWLIDPACHGGHREFDLAMMRLFSGFGEACFAAYQEQFALDDDWPSRIALHQLAPLLVHVIKFGRAYVAPLNDALRQYA